MFRLAVQILDYDPALIMTYDGANDLNILFEYNTLGMADLAIGAPENFKTLETLVDDIRANAEERAAVSLLASMFPELNKRFRQRSNTESSEAPSGSKPLHLSESVMQGAAAKYLSNLYRMRNLAEAEGARFIAVFQPVSRLHEHIRPEFESDDLEKMEYKRFHKAVFDRHSHDFEFVDLSSVFDQYFADIPAMDRDIDDKTVFIDTVHLYDPGNEIVARHLAKVIR
jgi:hypothetical protein